MTEDKAVFVVGAGAGFELKMPLGANLRDQISRLVNFKISPTRSREPRYAGDPPPLESGDRTLFEACEHYCKALKCDVTLEQLTAEGMRLSDAIYGAPSIDTVLGMNKKKPAAQRIGKLAIARAILQAETESPLYQLRDRPRLSLAQFKDTWLHSLFHVLTAGCEEADLETRFQRYALVVFNYDRCIEYYLRDALVSVYDLSQERAEAVLGALSIFHVYGWLGSPFGEGAMPFGHTATPAQICDVAAGIKTYTEDFAVEDEPVAIQQCIYNARKLVFLGMAYHSQNLRLLWTKSAPGSVSALRQGPDIVGTRFAISDHDLTIIKTELSQLSRTRPAGIDFADTHTSCNDFFRQRSRELQQM